jgi:hypothetical protein
MHRVQTLELHLDSQQEGARERASGDEEVLQVLWEAHCASGEKVAFSKRQ